MVGAGGEVVRDMEMRKPAGSGNGGSMCFVVLGFEGTKLERVRCEDFKGKGEV